MTNQTEKKEELRKKLDSLVERLFPDLSAPELVTAAQEFERALS